MPPQWLLLALALPTCGGLPAPHMTKSLMTAIVPTSRYVRHLGTPPELRDPLPPSLRSRGPKWLSSSPSTPPPLSSPSSQLLLLIGIGSIAPMKAVLRSAAQPDASEPAPVRRTAWGLVSCVDVSLLLCLFFWYLGNYYYNIANKISLRATGGISGAPLTVASLELAVGVMYAWFLWLAPDARQAPTLRAADLRRLLPLAVAFAGNHFATVVAMSAGAVSFGQIVKASEPAFCALLGTLLYSQHISVVKWLAFIPVIGGVCLACAAELQFSVPALLFAVLSNVFAAVKVNENRRAMDAPGLRGRLGSVGNQFAVTMTLAWLLSAPLVLWAEWRRLPALVAVLQTGPGVLANVILAGLWFYWHNELATIFVKKTGPVTQSVASTAKRVIVIVACGLVLGESLQPQKVLGCVVGIAGVFLYSVADELRGPRRPADP
eukprot:EG_transcript_12345